jgi:kynurenine formamidase
MDYDMDTNYNQLQRSNTEYIDLSITIENSLPSDPPFMVPKIAYTPHEAGAEEMSMFFEGMNPSNHLPDGKGWAVETVTLTTHSGTHLDAPWHYAPVMDRSTNERKAWTIDQVPLEWCVGHLVVLDLSEMPDGHVAAPNDIGYALDKLN